MQHDLEEEVAQLFGERRRRALLERVVDLVRLLEQELAQRQVVLFAVPGTTVGRAQPRDQPRQSVRARDVGQRLEGRYVVRARLSCRRRLRRRLIDPPRRGRGRDGRSGRASAAAILASDAWAARPGSAPSSVRGASSGSNRTAIPGSNGRRRRPAAVRSWRPSVGSAPKRDLISSSSSGRFGHRPQPTRHGSQGCGRLPYQCYSDSITWAWLVKPEVPSHARHHSRTNSDVGDRFSTQLPLVRGTVDFRSWRTPEKLSPRRAPASCRPRSRRR